jgi:hypothetical protein
MRAATPRPSPTSPAVTALAVTTRPRWGDCSRDTVTVWWRNSDVTTSTPISNAARAPLPAASNTASSAREVPIDGFPSRPALYTGCKACTTVATSVTPARIQGHRIVLSFRSSAPSRVSIALPPSSADVRPHGPTDA